jgi:predicted transcriptional regulator
MATVKLFDSELKIMDIVWDKEPVTAKEITLIASKIIGWNKNTTYA